MISVFKFMKMEILEEVLLQTDATELVYSIRLFVILENAVYNSEKHQRNLQRPDNHRIFPTTQGRS